MSFVHFALVGHFDPKVVHCDLTVSNEIDQALVKRLLDDYPPEVADYVTIENGYVHCSWAPTSTVRSEVLAFAYQLAREACCISVENQPRYP